MGNAERYIEKYKELEEVVRSTYKLNYSDSISYYLSHEAKYRYLKDEITYCQEVRNLLQHKKKINDSYPVEPADETILFISSLIERIKNKKKCKDICIPASSIFYKKMSDSVQEAMKVMRKNKYTCVPILDDWYRVIGVFDENSLFECIFRSNGKLIPLETG